MRLHALFALTVVSAAPALAQTAPAKDSAAAVAPLQTSGPALTTAGMARLRTQLSILRLMGYTATLPTVDKFASGNQTIPAGAVVNGPFTTASEGMV